MRKMSHIPIIWGTALILLLFALSMRGQAPVQPTPSSYQITVDTNLHIVTIQASFFQSNLDTLLPAILGSQTGTNALVQQYQLNLVSNLLAGATNTLLADFLGLQAVALTNGGTNYSFVAQSTTNNVGYLAVTNTATIKNLNVTNQLNADYLAVLFDIFGNDGQVTNNWHSGSSTVDLNATVGGSLTVTSNTISGHYGGGGSGPSVGGVSTGAGSGGSPTASTAGDANPTDSSFTLTVVTGTSPATSSTICTVSFAKPYLTVPKVYVVPASQAASALSAASIPFVLSTAVTTNGFTLTSGTSALSGTTTYRWNFLVIQ